MHPRQTAASYPGPRSANPYPALRRLLIPIALLYSFLAGLKTVPDFDLGWQMATGRYILTHHAIPRTELFSYTSHGVEWIYPILSCLVFSLLYRLAGYAAISWLCALTCVGCTTILIYRRSLWAVALAVLAVPVFASEIMPRASLFTMLLFTCFARILLGHFEGSFAEPANVASRPSPLWSLPLLMLFWVNLHPGFIAGLALIAAYLLVELLETPFPSRRRSVLLRLRQAIPWILATLAATLVNPWGIRVFAAVFRQQTVTAAQSAFLQEWSPVQLASALQSLSWRNPDGAAYWLLALGILISVLCLWQRQLGASLVLLAAIFAFLRHQRMEGPCIILICLIGGSFLAKAANSKRSPSLQRFCAAAVVAFLTILAAIRSYDIVTNRTYISSGAITLFGVGPSWWLPEKATDFLLKNHLSANVFSSFNLSSYLLWRLGNQYPDFADGRYIPFGQRLFDQQRMLTSLPLDSPEWTQAADTYHIHTVILPLSRIFALGDFPLLANCESKQWTPVYMDTQAILFVRNDPSGLAPAYGSIDCQTQNLLPPATSSPSNSRTAAERYQRLANASGIYSVLGRYQDAEAAANLANRIFSGDPTLTFIRAQTALGEHKYAESEQYLRSALAIQQTDAGWYNLALLCLADHRLPEAVDALEKSARLSPEAYQRYLLIGKILLAEQQPQPALDELTKAGRDNPYTGNASPEAAEFNAQVFEEQAYAYLELHQPQQAVEAQLSAVRQTPNNPQRREALARDCKAAGIDCPTP